MTTRCGPIQAWQHESGGFQAEGRRQYQPGDHLQELSGPKTLGRSFDQKVFRSGCTERCLRFDRDQEPGGCDQVCQKKHKGSKAAACLGCSRERGDESSKKKGKHSSTGGAPGPSPSPQAEQAGAHRTASREENIPPGSRKASCSGAASPRVRGNEPLPGRSGGSLWRLGKGKGLTIVSP